MQIGPKTRTETPPWLARLSRPKEMVCAALILITLAIYSPVLENDFVSYDDGDYLTANSVVKAGLTLSGIAWAFENTLTGNWHPVTWISHMLDCELFGVSPGGHHAVNVLLHSANAFLLLVVLSRMTGAFWRSALVAALFAWHPLHVESVAWISERKDLLSTAFGLLALLYYYRYVTEGNRRALWLSVGMLGLSLMSKPMLVTLPFVLLLLDYWPLERVLWKSGARPDGTSDVGVSGAGIKKVSIREALLEKVPYFALIVLSSAVAVWAQGRAKAIATTEALSVQSRLVNVVGSYVTYLKQMVWPTKLIVPYLTDFRKGLPELWVPLLILLAIMILVLRLPARKYLFTGWCFYLGTLVPVIGFLHIGEQAHADRYTYIPLIGIFVALAWGSRELFARLPQSRAVGVVFLGMGLLACCGMTWRQTHVWRTSETLFSHTLLREPGNWLALERLGFSSLEAGNAERALFYFQEFNRVAPPVEKTARLIAEALNALNRPLDGIKVIEAYAARTRGISPELRLTLGELAENAGDTGRANAEYQQAQAAKATGAKATLHLATLKAGARLLPEAEASYRQVLTAEPGNVIATLGLASVQCDLGQVEDARRLLERAMAVNPFSYDEFYRLATVQAKLGMTELAERNFLQAIEKNRLYYDSYYNLGNLYARHGAFTNAVRMLGKAVQLKPSAAEARNNFGVALVSMGEFGEAATQYREALKLSPTMPDAYYGLARILELETNYVAAGTNYARAIRFKPDFHEARLGLAVILIRQGKYGEAVPQLEVYLKANPASGFGHLQMGTALLHLKLAANALPHLNRAVELRPRDRVAIDTLARLLATAPEAAVRNGARAVELSEMICQPREQTSPAMLDTLAAAHAELGAYDQARAIAGLALEAARLTKDTAAAAMLEKHLALYKAGQPLREAD